MVLLVCTANSSRRRPVRYSGRNWDVLCDFVPFSATIHCIQVARVVSGIDTCLGLCMASPQSENILGAGSGENDVLGTGFCLLALSAQFSSGPGRPHLARTRTMIDFDFHRFFAFCSAGSRRLRALGDCTRFSYEPTPGKPKENVSGWGWVLE